jgi:hypothetical protein
MRGVLTIVLLLLALLNAGVWMLSHLWHASGLELKVPVARSGQIHFLMWKPIDDTTSEGPDHSLTHSVAGPLTAAIWYQHLGIATMTRIAKFDLPTWPLLAITAYLILLAAWLWLGDRSPLGWWRQCPHALGHESLL